MKKYLKLTAREAISHFLLNDSTLAPGTSDEIRTKLADLGKLESGISVTIVFPTHRVAPGMDQDPIMMKNKIDEAERLLYEKFPKREVWPIAENLREAEQAVDHRLNLDSLVVYANADFSSVVKLPVELPAEVVIGREFDLRPLYRAMQQNRHYYIITVSKQLIRLFEAFNDRIVTEFTSGGFPFPRTSRYITLFEKQDSDNFVDNMEKEFYNDADKNFRAFRNENPMPVVLLGDVKSTAWYGEQMDDSDMVIGRAAGSYDNAPAHTVVAAAYPELVRYRELLEKSNLDDIDAAASAHRLSESLGDIVAAAREGSADTLYIADDLSLDSRIRRENFNTADGETNAADVRSLLLRSVRQNGGRVVFMPPGLLSRYDGLVLSRRY